MQNLTLFHAVEIHLQLQDLAYQQIIFFNLKIQMQYVFTFLSKKETTVIEEGQEAKNSIRRIAQN